MCISSRLRTLTPITSGAAPQGVGQGRLPARHRAQVSTDVGLGSDTIR
jgi:hypothetical protein